MERVFKQGGNFKDINGDLGIYCVGYYKMIELIRATSSHQQGDLLCRRV